MKPIALLTDFGTSDAYVGTMKGVMLGIAPDAQFVDLTHAIAPQQVKQAAYVLLTAYRHFPKDTVFLVVVDPGVGTPRAPIAVQTEHGIFVAPDNGVLSYVLARLRVIHAVGIDRRDIWHAGMSSTFHGRDIFGPAAAHLAAGAALSDIGSPITTWITLPDPVLQITPDAAIGEVLHIDHFGNAITSIGQLTWIDQDTLLLTPEFGQSRPTDSVRFRAAGCQIIAGRQALSGIRRAYGMVPPGQLTALVGSSGQLEVTQNHGSAAHALRLSSGDPVTMRTDT